MGRAYPVHGAVHKSLSAIDFLTMERACVAVSGGSDSVALLMLLKRHIDAIGAKTSLQAVTVDHGLRPQSAAEARTVSKICTSIGIPHRTMEWRRSAPVTTGVAAAAREARYRLLAEAAMEFRSEIVFAGHTLDDQAETVAMRLRRGTGRGLAGIAPLTAWRRSVWIVRPLLTVSRATLREFLRKNGTGWIDDPSNADTRYERARMRLELAHVPDHESRIAELLTICHSAQEQRVEEQLSAARLIDEHARQPAPGLFQIPADVVCGNGKAVGLALRAMMAVAGGREQLPDAARAAALIVRLCRKDRRVTLGGCEIASKRGRVYVWREFRGFGPAPVTAMDGTVWDGRWRLVGGGDLTGLEIGPAGRNAVPSPFAGKHPPPPNIRRAAIAALPVLRKTCADAEEGAPAFCPGVFRPVLAPWEKFLPSFDLDIAASFDRLAEARAIPTVPGTLKKMLPV